MSLDIFSDKREPRAIPPNCVPFDRQVFREFIDYLKELRGGVIDKNLTHQEIAREIGVSASRFGKYYNGYGYTPYDVRSISKDVVAALENLWTQYEIDAHEALGQQSKKTHRQVDDAISEKQQKKVRDYKELASQRQEWEFAPEWFDLSYTEAMKTVIDSFDSAYVQGISKLARYKMTHAAKLADIDRKHFRRLFNWCDGQPVKMTLADDDLSMPFKELKEQIVRDFQRQYFSRALEKTQGNITLAADNIKTDRKNFKRALKKAAEASPFTLQNLT